MTDQPNGSHADLSEGDVNLSPRRAAWAAEHIGPQTADLLEQDTRYFFHQALSTPCLNALAACEGAEIVDTQGRRFLDFHGNYVHQVGYRNPAVIEAVKAQLDSLPFCPRRYTNAPAIHLARPGQRKPGGLRRSPAAAYKPSDRRGGLRPHPPGAAGKSPRRPDRQSGAGGGSGKLPQARKGRVLPPPVSRRGADGDSG